MVSNTVTNWTNLIFSTLQMETSEKTLRWAIVYIIYVLKYSAVVSWIGKEL